MTKAKTVTAPTGLTFQLAKPGLFERRPEWQAREEKELDLEHVAQLVAVLEDGGWLPPISVVKLASGAFAIVDGYHRFEAFLIFGLDRIPFIVVAEGEERIEFQLGHANWNHGRGRSTATKRAAVVRTIKSPEGGDLDNVGIARWCGVSLDFVRSVRLELRGATSAQSERAARVQEAAKANPAASPGEIAKQTGVDRKTARKALAKVRGAEGGEIVGDPRSPHPEPGPETTDPLAPIDTAPLECVDEPRATDPTWQECAAANVAVMDAITELKRKFSRELRICAGSQRITKLLDEARGTAKANTPQACPAPHDGGHCPICNDRGFVIGDQGNVEAKLSAYRYANA